MLDRPSYFPLPPSSMRWQQQEQQQGYQSSSGLSARERDQRFAGRLSPELEIMRPVSPFQSKRQLPHQQAQSGLHSNALSSYHQSRPSQAQYSYDKVPPVLEMTVPTTASASARSKSSAYKGESAAMRGAQKDSDISPALRMMSYETNLTTPPSSDGGHGQARNGHAMTPRDKRFIQENRAEYNRSASPEGMKRRNPGWRKPVPKYISTPPSTPPSNNEDSILSAAAANEPTLASTAVAPGAQPPLLPAKAATTLALPAQDPPPRPMRAETAPNVPVMFRELTPSASLAESTRPRITPATPRRSAEPSTASEAAVRAANRAQSATTQSKAQAPAGPRPVPAAWKTSASDHQSPSRVARTYAQVLANSSNASTTAARTAPQASRQGQTAPARHAEAQRTEAPKAAEPAQVAQMPAAEALQARPSPAAEAQQARSTTTPVVTREASEARVQATREPVVSAAPVQQPLQVPAAAHVPAQASPAQALIRMAQASATALHLQVPSQAHLLSHGGVQDAQTQPVQPPVPLAAQMVTRLAQASTSSLPSQVTAHAHLPLSGSQHSPRVVPKKLEAKTDSQRSGSIHPPPRKVPSIAQLVAKALPSRTPSPRVSERNLSVDGHAITIHHGVNQGSKLALTDSISRASSPAARLDVGSEQQRLRTKVSQATLHTTESSAKSSRSVSPLPTPPQSSPAPPPPQPRSPLPAIPQYAPPLPPFPPPPPNTPVFAPKPRVASMASVLPFMNVEQLDDEPVKEVKEVKEAPPAPQQAAVFRSSLATPPDTPPSRTASQSMVDDEVVVFNLSEQFPQPPTTGRATRPVTPAPKPASVVQQTAPLAYSRSTTGGSSAAVPAFTSVPSAAPAPIARPLSPPLQLAAQSNYSASIAAPQARSDLSIGGVQRGFAASWSGGAASSSTPPAPPPTPANMASREVSTPPQLPPDWKEAIINAIRSSVTPAPVGREDFDENSSMLPPLQLAIQTSPADEKDESPTFTITGTWVQVKHAPTALDLEIREAETRPLPDNLQSEPGLSFAYRTNQEVQVHAQPPEVWLPRAKTESAPEQKVVSALDLEDVPEAPVRARSPVPRRKVPQVDYAPVPKAETRTARQEEEAWALVPPQPVQPAQPEPEPMSTSSAPPVSHTTRSSRSRSSGPRKRARNTRRRAEEDSDYATQWEDAQEVVLAEVADIELLPPVVAPPPLTVDSPVTRCISPPPRSESLTNVNQPRRYAPSPEPRRVDRLPNNNSQRHLAPSPEPEPRQLERLPNNHSQRHLAPSPEPWQVEVSRQQAEPLASPNLPTRSLSPTRQIQNTPKHAKSKPHGQHKHAPAAEQQAFRPPTPPLPSHYRKKRSEDVLPADGLSPFMKPPLHVLYPDTSTSHGHSLSTESAFAMAGARSPQVRPIDHVLDDGDMASPDIQHEHLQSPSLSSFNSLEKEEDYEIYDNRPKVPPKAKRGKESESRSPREYPSYSNFAIHPVSRGRYPSAPIGEARAHTLTLPPSSSDHSRSQGSQERQERLPGEGRQRRRGQPYASRAARSMSEKVERRKDAHPMSRTRSSPLPSSRRRPRRGVWRIFGLWARIFMTKFRSWTSEPSHSPVRERRHDDDYYSSY